MKFQFNLRKYALVAPLFIGFSFLGSCSLDKAFESNPYVEIEKESLDKILVKDSLSEGNIENEVFSTNKKKDNYGVYFKSEPKKISYSLPSNESQGHVRAFFEYEEKNFSIWYFSNDVKNIYQAIGMIELERRKNNNIIFTGYEGRNNTIGAYYMNDETGDIRKIFRGYYSGKIEHGKSSTEGETFIKGSSPKN